MVFLDRNMLSFLNEKLCCVWRTVLFSFVVWFLPLTRLEDSSSPVSYLYRFITGGTHFVVDHLAKPLPLTCVPSNNLSSNISLHITSAVFLFSPLNSFLIAQYVTWDSLPCLEPPYGNSWEGINQPSLSFEHFLWSSQSNSLFRSVRSLL